MLISTTSDSERGHSVEITRSLPLAALILSRLKPIRHYLAQLGALEAPSQCVDNFKMRAIIPLIDSDPVRNMQTRDRFDLHVHAGQLEEALHENRPHHALSNQSVSLLFGDAFLRD